MKRLPGLAFLLLASACTSATTEPPVSTAPTSTTAATTSPTVTESMATSTAQTTVPTITPPAPDHRIAIRVVDGEGEFFDTDTGETFTVDGVNYVFHQTGDGRWSSEPFDTLDYSPTRVRRDFETLADTGFTTVRMFLDPCDGQGCITVPGRDGLDPRYLDNIVDVIEAAADTGLYLLLTSNDIPDFGGYGDEANSGATSQIAGYRNAHYLTTAGHRAAASYWTDLISGLDARGAQFDHVLGWSLLNEQWLFGDQPPLSLTAGEITTADGKTYDLSDPDQHREMVASNLALYVEQVTNAIRAADPTALITMGFFAPQFPNATAIGGNWYVDTASLIERGVPLDFYDFHAYPGEDIPLDQIAENFGVELVTDKPVVMGEYGAFIDRYATVQRADRALSAWRIASCDLGFDGWIYWSYRTNPTAGDSTWGLTSEDGHLLDLLSPDRHPEPCAPLAITGGVAEVARITASRALDDQPPSAAVDGDDATSWGSGADAPQWIELELAEPTDIATLRLLVAQYPNGPTTHRVLFDTGHGLAEVDRFEGATADGDWLEFAPAAPLAGVRRIRIETLSSPSWVAWREVEVVPAD